MFRIASLTMVKTKDIGRNSPRKPLRSGPVIKSTRRRSLLTAKASGCQANIRVVVRIRPTSQRESAENYRTVVKPLNNQLLIFDPEEYTEAFYYRGVQQRCRDPLKRPNKNIQFSFDRVFNEASENEEVFKDSTQGLIQSLMDGCNCSVFVYGATGAGKTFTMLGSAPDHPGITFLTMDELFKAIANLEHERKFELCVSYLEVYNECVQDLLVNINERNGPQGQNGFGGSSTSLQVQDSKFGVVVAGLTIRKITDSQELFDMLDKGNRNRTQHPTDANAESSRSHAVFQVYLQMDVIATGQRRLAKLSMIDLAGSERGAATGCKGARFTEGANINKSLLALGNCINALADGSRHVPYRDSKLTRLLKDSLGGNCRTVMIANISPSSLCFEDSYNTLKYANRAKKIKANVQKNVGMGDLHVTQYMKLLEERNEENVKLKAENERLKAENEQLSLRSGSIPSTVPTLSTDGSGDNEFTSDIEDLRTMWAELCNFEERRRKLELNKKMLISRLEFQEAETNRSGIYCNSPDLVKVAAKSDRSQKQIGAFKTELDTLANSILTTRGQIKRFVEEKPFLKTESDKLLEKFTILQINLENAENYALYKLASDQLVRAGTQLDRTAELLKPCFWIARKYGYATPELVSKYELITEAPHSVTWRSSPLSDVPTRLIATALDSDGIDSGVSSTTTLSNPMSLTQLEPTTPNQNDINSDHTIIRSPKRKLICPNSTPKSIDLDSTYTLNLHTMANAHSSSTPISNNILQQQQQVVGKRLQSNIVTGNGRGNSGSVTSLSSLTSSSKAKRLATSRTHHMISSRHSPRFNQQQQRHSPRLHQPQLRTNTLESKQSNHNAQAKRMGHGHVHGTMGTAPRFASATSPVKGNRKPLATLAQQPQRYVTNYYSTGNILETGDGY